MQDIQDATPHWFSYAVDAIHCNGCGICVEVCPVDCICIEDYVACFSTIAETTCFQCGACQCACPRNAIRRSV